MAAVARAKRGIVLRELGIQRVGDELGQHVALLHALAFVGQHLGDAQALDLGADQDLLARHQRAGGEHRLDEVGRRDATTVTATAAAKACRGLGADIRAPDWYGCADERHGDQQEPPATTRRR